MIRKNTYRLNFKKLDTSELATTMSNITINPTKLKLIFVNKLFVPDGAVARLPSSLKYLIINSAEIESKTLGILTAHYDNADVPEINKSCEKCMFLETGKTFI